MRVFKEVLATNELRLLTRWGKPSQKTLYRAWCAIFNQVDSKYRIMDDYREYLRLRLKASDYYAKYAETGNKLYLTKAEIKEIEAREVGNKEVIVQDFDVSCAALTKRLGIKINPLTVTVSEFMAFQEVG